MRRPPPVLPSSRLGRHAQFVAANDDPEEVRLFRAGLPGAISRLQAEVESGLTLQGATAIEDKLQVRL